MTPAQFKKLKSTWYKKLKASGFDDVERDEDSLRVWSTRFMKDRSMEWWESKQAYYQMATNFLVDHKFDNTIEKIIWEYHANGISVRNIAKLLNNLKHRKKVSRSWVWLVVHRLEESMKEMYLSGYKSRNE